MMQQAADIRDAVQPDEILFVLDAMIGQDAVTTAQAFADGVGFTGVVLSKLDGDARGGAALSVVGVTGTPVMFASTGEKLTDFELFHPDRMASRILDMGDVLTLIEQAEKAFDAKQAEEMAAKLAADEDFTLEDFLAQMAALRNMGSIKKMLGMLPGMGELRDQLENFDEREMDRIEAIVRSMTPLERRQPKILNGSRRLRIAKGSGVQVSDVNQLLERFGEAQKMMRAMRRGMGMPGHGRRRPGAGGMPALPGVGKKSRGGRRRRRRARARASPATRPSGPSRSATPRTAPRRPGRRRGRAARSGSARAASAGARPGRPGAAAGVREVPRPLTPTPTPGQLRSPRSETCQDCGCHGDRDHPSPARPVLVGPDDEVGEAWVVGGRITFERPDGARCEPVEGWVLPGLVDAHNHIGLDAHGAVDEAGQEAQARTDLAAGTMLIRDAGSPADTRWIDEREDLPRIVRAGRHIARTRRYLPGVGHEIEPEQLADEVRTQAARGDGWVKLVGDWIDREIGDLAPCWPAWALREAMDAAHAAGARVTAHCFGEDCLPDLIEAGIDCIEHATGLTEDTVRAAAARGTAIVPTLVNIDNFPSFAAAGEAKFPVYAAHLRRLHAEQPPDPAGRLRRRAAGLRRHRRRRSDRARAGRRRGRRPGRGRHPGRLGAGRRLLGCSLLARTPRSGRGRPGRPGGLPRGPALATCGCSPTRRSASCADVWSARRGSR